MRAHQPDREHGEQRQKIERRLKSGQGVLERKRRGDREPHDDRHDRKISSSRSEPQNGREHHSRQRVKHDVDDHLKLRIPLTVDLQERQCQHPREENAVFVVMTEHVAPGQAILQEGHVQADRLAVPLVPERHGHRVFPKQRQLRPQHGEKQGKQPEAVAQVKRTCRQVTCDEGHSDCDEYEHGARNPCERKGRHELEAVPPWGSRYPTAPHQ